MAVQICWGVECLVGSRELASGSDGAGKADIHLDESAGRKYGRDGALDASAAVAEGRDGWARKG